MLLDLTNDYVRFLSTYSLQKRKENLGALHALLQSKGYGVSTDEIREVYQEMFKKQLELIVSSNFKKPEQLTKALEQNLEANGDAEMYHALVLGINSADLDVWAREVTSLQAQIQKRQNEIEKEKNKNKGFFGRMFGGKDDQSEQEKQAQLAEIEREI